MLRDHGPNDPGFLLVMLVLATYMDRHGFAYPGQPTWAKAARKSVRMLQRYIARGRGLGWLEVINAGRGGKGWAFNGYRCCIPDGIELNEKDEAIATAIVAEAGDVDGDDTVMLPPSDVGRDIAMSPPIEKSSTKHSNPGGLRGTKPSASTVQAQGRDDMASKMVTTSEALGGDKSSNLVATQLWRTNSRSENSHSENSREGLKVGLTATTLTNRDEMLAAKAQEQKDRKRASIIRLLKTGTDEADIVRYLGKSQGVTPDDVRRAALEAT